MRTKYLPKIPEKLKNSKNYPRIFGALGEDLVCKKLNLIQNKSRFNSSCDARDDTGLKYEIKTTTSAWRVSVNKHQARKCLNVDRFIVLSINNDTLKFYELNKQDRQKYMYNDVLYNYYNKEVVCWDLDNMHIIYSYKDPKTVQLFNRWHPNQKYKEETIIKKLDKLDKPVTKLQRIKKKLEWNIKDNKKMTRLEKLLEWNIKDNNCRYNLRSK